MLADQGYGWCDAFCDAGRLFVGATLLSFLVALLHFITETLIFKTMSWRGALSPLIVAGEHVMLMVMAHAVTYAQVLGPPFFLLPRGNG